MIAVRCGARVRRAAGRSVWPTTTRTSGSAASIIASDSLPAALASSPTTRASDSKRRWVSGVKMSGALRGHGSNTTTARSLILASLGCRETQRRGQLHVLRGEPQPHDAPVRAAEARRIGFQLNGVAAVVGEAERAVGIRRRVAALLMGDEAALEQHDGRAAHRLPRRIDHPAFHDAVIVAGDVHEPQHRDDGDRAGHDHPAREEPARQLHPFVAPEVRPRMNSFWAIRNTRIDGASTMTAKAYSAP